MFTFVRVITLILHFSLEGSDLFYNCVYICWCFMRKNYNLVLSYKIRLCLMVQLNGDMTKWRLFVSYSNSCF